jgi:hypothetical protein
MFTGCTAHALYAWLPVYMAQAEEMCWDNAKFVEVDIVELTLKTINAELSSSSLLKHTLLRKYTLALDAPTT